MFYPSSDLVDYPTSSNVPMVIGVSVCVGTLIIIIVIIIVMKRTNMCELGQVPEERRPGRRNRRRRTSAFDSLRRSFLHRTPPPSYGRATKPPTYEEALRVGNLHFGLFPLISMEQNCKMSNGY